MIKIASTEAKIPPERLPGAPETTQKGPQKALATIFGSKKRADKAQGSSKTKLEAPFGRSRNPREPPRDPKNSNKSQREPQTASQTIFGSKMMIFQKPSSRPHKTNIFEGRKVSLGAQNRPQEAPRRDKKRHRKKKKERRRKKEHQERQKELQKALPPFDPATSVCR